MIIHGGGATGVTQVNDTDLHQHLRKAYLEKETAEMVRRARLNPSGTPVPTPQNCVSWMVDIWSNPQLHLDASKGFKRTGITNALDGSEDHFIAREAKYFWQNLNMASQRNAAIHDVAIEVEAVRIQWDFAGVYSLVSDFPETGHLDKILEFQDDELVLEEGSREPIWDEEEDDEQGVFKDDDVEEIHGDGVDADHISKPALRDASATSRNASISAEQSDVVIKHGARRDALRKALEIASRLNSPSLEISISRILHDEERKMHGRLQTDPAVAQAIERNRMAEELAIVQEQKVIKNQLAAKNAAKESLKETKEHQLQLQRVKAQLREAKDLVAAKEALKSYTPDMLGEGRPRGGGAAFRTRRQEVLDRLLTHGNLTPQQRNDWNWFKEEWDKVMADTHGISWGSEFAKICQGLLEQVRAGQTSAVSEFMYSETRRCLSDVALLRL